MRRKCRSLTVLMIVLTFVFSIGLSGCKQGKEETGSSQKESSDQVAKLKPVILKYRTYGVRQKDDEKVWKAFNEKLAEYLPNTTVEFEMISGAEYADKWKTSMAAREQIDMAWWGWMLDIGTEVSMGSIMGLNDLLNQYGRNIRDVYHEKYLKTGVVANETYIVPVWQGWVRGTSCVAIPTELLKYTNEEKMREALASQDVGKKYEVVEEYLANLLKAGEIRDGLDIGTGLGLVSTADLRNWFNVLKGDDTFSVQYHYATDYYKDWLAHITEWYRKGYIRKDLLSLTNKSPNVKDGGLKYVMFNPNTVKNKFEEEKVSKNVGYDIALIETSKQMYGGNEGANTAYCIPTTSKNPERAMMLMDLLVSETGKDLAKIFVYGLEGEHYTSNSNGTITVNDTSDGQESAYRKTAWTFGNLMFGTRTQSDIPGYFEHLLELEKGDVATSPFLTFKPKTDTFVNELSNVKNVREEYKYLGYGVAKDFEIEWKEYIDKLNRAGLKKIIDETQKQVNEFVKQNNIKW